MRHVAAGSCSLSFPDHLEIYLFIFPPLLPVEAPAVYFDHIGAVSVSGREGTVRSLISEKSMRPHFCLTPNTYRTEINGPLMPPDNYTLLRGSISPLVLAPNRQALN